MLVHCFTVGGVRVYQTEPNWLAGMFCGKAYGTPSHSHFTEGARTSAASILKLWELRAPTLHSRHRSVRKIGICVQLFLQKCFPGTLGLFLTESMMVSSGKHRSMDASSRPLYVLWHPSFSASFSSVPSSVGAGPNRGRWFVLGRTLTPLKCWTPMNVPSWRDPPASNPATSSPAEPNGLTQNGAW